MITATSAVKSVSQVTNNTRPKPVWQPQCATQVGRTPSAGLKSVCYPKCATEVVLQPQCATQVGVTPQLRDSSLSDQSQFSVWIGWSVSILVWIVWSELVWVAHLIQGFLIMHLSRFNIQIVPRFHKCESRWHVGIRLIDMHLFFGTSKVI